MKHILAMCLLLLSFYLGLHQNRLTIFEDNKPIFILPYRDDLYPEKDRARLKEGIPFESNEELAELQAEFIS